LQGDGTRLSCALDCARLQGFTLVGMRAVRMSAALAQRYVDGAGMTDAARNALCTGQAVVVMALQRDNAVTCAQALLMGRTPPSLLDMSGHVLLPTSVAQVGYGCTFLCDIHSSASVAMAVALPVHVCASSCGANGFTQHRAMAAGRHS